MRNSVFLQYTMKKYPKKLQYTIYNFCKQFSELLINPFNKEIDNEEEFD